MSDLHQNTPKLLWHAGLKSNVPSYPYAFNMHPHAFEWSQNDKHIEWFQNDLTIYSRLKVVMPILWHTIFRPFPHSPYLRSSRLKSTHTLYAFQLYRPDAKISSVSCTTSHFRVMAWIWEKFTDVHTCTSHMPEHFSLFSLYGKQFSCYCPIWDIASNDQWPWHIQGKSTHGRNTNRPPPPPIPKFSSVRSATISDFCGTAQFRQNWSQNDLDRLKVKSIQKYIAYNPRCPTFCPFHFTMSHFRVMTQCLKKRVSMTPKWPWHVKVFLCIVNPRDPLLARLALRWVFFELRPNVDKMRHWLIQ